MSKNQFHIGRYYVDGLRNQISHAGSVLPVEPKVLEVLLLLADHQGQVVTYGEIARAIWPDAVVEPNALQRCITKLRKALGDDAKTQSVIVTHTKKGYSLIAEVKWQRRNSSQLQFKSLLSHPLSVSITLVFLLSVLIISLYKNGSEQSFLRLTPLTHSGKPEYFSSFSPNGHYLAFTREDSESQSDLWVTNIEQKTEFKLSNFAGHVAEPAWSIDGKKIAFILRSLEGDQDVAAVYIAHFDDTNSEKNSPLNVLQCAAVTCTGLVWLTDKTLSFIAHDSDGSKITTFDLQTKIQRTLFEIPGVFVYSMDYSDVNHQLAGTLINQRIEHKLFLYDLATTELKINNVDTPAVNLYDARWPIKWNAKHNGFITSSVNEILHVSLQGDVITEQVPTYKYVLTPEFHPTGDSIALALGYVDLDINQFDWSPKNRKTISTLERSSRREYSAQYKPYSEAIAFISDRAGRSSLWLREGDALMNLSEHGDLFGITDFRWSPDGQALVALKGNELFYSTGLAGQWRKIETDFPVLRLYQWSSQNRLLVSTYAEQTHMLVSLNTQDTSFEVVYRGDFDWGRFNAADGYLYIGYQGKLIQVNQDGSIIEHDTGQFKVGTQALMRGNSLYWIGEDSRLRAYSFSQKQVENITALPIEHITLSDVNLAKKQLLFTTHVGTHKEIMLLHN